MSEFPTLLKGGVEVYMRSGGLVFGLPDSRQPVPYSNLGQGPRQSPQVQFEGRQTTLLIPYKYCKEKTLGLGRMQKRWIYCNTS